MSARAARSQQFQNRGSRSRKPREQNPNPQNNAPRQLEDVQTRRVQSGRVNIDGVIFRCPHKIADGEVIKIAKVMDNNSRLNGKRFIITINDRGKQQFWLEDIKE